MHRLSVRICLVTVLFLRRLINLHCARVRVHNILSADNK